MSLSDQLRYLRAVRHEDFDITYQVLGQKLAQQLCLIEQRMSDASDDESVGQLAAYFGVSVESLQWHRARTRKALTAYLKACLQQHQPVTLVLRSGETLTGQMAWWDMAAIGLQLPQPDAVIVVQRHAVVDWENAEAIQAVRG